MSTQVESSLLYEGKRGVSPRAVIRNISDGKILLLRRPKTSTHFPGDWEFPGGKPDRDEGFSETLKREVREETGLTITPGAVVGYAEGQVGAVCVLYVFVEAETDSTRLKLSKENDTHRWVDLAELARLGSLDNSEKTGTKSRATSKRDQLVPHFKAFAVDYARRHGFTPVTTTESGTQSKTDPTAVDAKLLSNLDGWIAGFRKVQPRYTTMGETLEDLMKERLSQLCPMAVIGGRTKGVASFARKILSKNKYRDPLVEMTDLYGLRIITQIDAEVEAVRLFIRSHPDLFVIDEKNSEDKLSRLRSGEFGYRSVHFVLSLTENAVPQKLRHRKLHELKAEVQIRTQLQHAWADIGHDRLYKGAFKPPLRFQRESARIAALLESADEAFSRLVDGLDEYECHFGSYLDTNGIRKQISVQHAILLYDPGNSSEVLRLARLHLSLDTPDDRKAAEEAVCRFPEEARTPDLWCALGDSLRQWKSGPTSSRMKKAREAYEKALLLEPAHKDAMIGLAEASATDRDKLAAYDAACRANPDDPETLSGYIRQKIKVDHDVSFLPLLRPSLLASIEQCRKQIEVNVDIPWAYYRMAGFHLLLGGASVWDAYDALARAIRCDSKNISMMTAALDAVTDLLITNPGLEAARAVKRILLAAIRIKCPDCPASVELDTLRSSEKPILGPVVIVAGGCDPKEEEHMVQYRSLLEQSLRGFQGTVISGGTEQGIAGLVGELGAKAKAGEAGYTGIRAIGYLPSHLPTDETATVDRRYHEHRRSRGTTGFSVMEPLQNWIDLLISGIDPGEVHVIGINGGVIAGFEYRLAWALGAKVALLRDSGRIADSFEIGIRDGDYEGMYVVPHDAMSVQAFIHNQPYASSVLPDGARERLARYAHALFLEERRHQHTDPAMQAWESLREDLRDSNLNQVDQMVRHLQAYGFRIVPLAVNDPIFSFGPDDDGLVEKMAEAEHGRWNIERIGNGWRFGATRDQENKIHPSIISWRNLDEKSKQWDRNVILRYPAMLAEAGLGIVRGE